MRIPGFLDVMLHGLVGCSWHFKGMCVYHSEGSSAP